MLRPIGWWIESLEDEELPAPQEFIGQQSADVTEALALYLANGLRLVQYRGRSWCRFVCGIEHSKMGSWDLTDGVWVWPEGLVHYVEAHRVLLPEEFVDHVLSGYAPRKPEADGCDDLADWVRWCAPRRVPAIVESRGAALVAAQSQLALPVAELVEALERQHGLSTGSCQWVGCTRQALSGVAGCAEHWIRASAKAPLELALRDWLRGLAGSGMPRRS